MKTIYSETVGTATVELIDATTDYIVALTDGEINKRIFTLEYGTAIRLYDETIARAAKLHGVTLPSIGRPDFVSTISA